MNFQVDFTGSVNIGLSENELIQKTVIEPFTTKIVARFLLNKSWKIKTKFKYTLDFVSRELQEKFTEEENNEIIEHRRKLRDMNETDYLIDIQMQEKIISLLERQNVKFYDFHFPPVDESTGFTQEEQMARFNSLIQWRKSKFSIQQENLFLKIHPSNIKQGKLKDCWVLSALSCLAENEQLIKRLFYKKEIDNTQYYQVKICQQGIWQYLIIDDYFPCFPLDGPIFTKTIEKDLWVMILEKSYAKILGNYRQLEVGNCRHSLVDFTGCPVFTYKMTDKDMIDLINNGECWNLLNFWKNSKYLIAVGIKSQKEEDHSYSILQIRQIDNNRLIQLRNIWGKVDWNGDWSPKSDKWTQDMKDELQYDPSQEDLFWLSYEDFIENFDIIYVCMVNNWQETRMKGKFVQVIDKNNPKITHFSSRYYYDLSLSQFTKVIIGVHQEDERKMGVSDLRPYLDIGISVFKELNGNYEYVAHCDTDYQREQFLEIDLEKGNYIIVPRSIGVCLNFLENNEIYSYDNNDIHFHRFAEDLFHKNNMENRGYLDFKTMKVIYEYTGEDLTESNFFNLCQNFNPSLTSQKNLTFKGFKNWLLMLFSKNEQNIFEFLNKTGYSKNFISKRSRLFTLTIHSNNMAKLTVKDALTDNIDFSANNLLVKCFGKPLSSTQKETDLIEGFFYHNELINSFTYSMINKTDKPAKVILDVSRCQNLVHSLNDEIITKIVDPNSMEFMLHSIPASGETNIIRDTSISFKILDNQSLYIQSKYQYNQPFLTGTTLQG